MINNPPDMTDLDDLDARHVEIPARGYTCCGACLQLWPCTTHVLVGEVRRLQEYVRRLADAELRAEAVLLWERHYAQCRHCQHPMPYTWRCSRGAALYAAVVGNPTNTSPASIDKGYVGNVRFVAHPDNTSPNATPYDLTLRPGPVVRAQALTEAEAEARDGRPHGLDLDVIAARVNAATTGPWEVMDYADPHDGSACRCVGMQRATDGPWWAKDSTILEAADAVFIAHARTDVPALVAEVRRLRALERRVVLLEQARESDVSFS